MTPRRSGIGEYSAGLCTALLEHCAEDVALSVYASGAIRAVSSPAQLREATAGLREGSYYALAHQWELPALLRRERCDVFHAPDFYTSFVNRRVPLLLGINDVVPLALPQYLARSRKTRLLPLYRAAIARGIRLARRVITLSEFSKREILRFVRCDPDKIHVIPLAPQLPLSGAALPARLATALRGRPYLLYVGRRDPYKGLALLLDAFRRAEFRAADMALMIAGAPDERYPLGPAIADAGLASQVLETGYVSAADLSALYAHACAFVMPSLYEGFGLPPLDAMRHGVPVACSDRASLPEVTGDAALLFDPTDADAFAAALRRVSSDDALRTALGARGARQCAQFTWERTARLTVGAYREALHA